MMGNPSRMGQLIKALMDNAVKYSRAKGAGGGRLEPAGRKWGQAVGVQPGEPIPEDKRTLIFRRFYRDDSARSSTIGCGLGLAIAAETARSHRARIGVEYRDGMNCFYVTV
ncbi:MAG: ATP-binding protein [Enterocloster clostridioformis]